MRRSLPPALALAGAALLLAGCTSAPSAAEPTTVPSSAPSSPTPTPTVEPQIVVSLDGIAVTDETGTRDAALDDTEAVLDLLEETTGELPEPEKVETFPGYDFSFVNYIWDGLRVFTDTEHEGPASVALTGPSVGGVPITTAEGLAVGSTRAELLDAGAWALDDSEDPATAEFLGLGGREAPGTESLSHPGSTGIVYTLFWFDGDTVKQIQVPSNDYSDL
ncbi:hypothetical protein [Microbacterium oxydans]|uniref:hypothetical protein n=1 Tax=Microbacterium oxydans TaxID=82380 RepID=UPI0024AE0B4F|nr:hypothetical protein [Microbacterium oxydans]